MYENNGCNVSIIYQSTLKVRFTLSCIDFFFTYAKKSLDSSVDLTRLVYLFLLVCDEAQDHHGSHGYSVQNEGPPEVKVFVRHVDGSQDHQEDGARRQDG